GAGPVGAGRARRAGTPGRGLHGGGIGDSRGGDSGGGRDRLARALSVTIQPPRRSRHLAWLAAGAGGLVVLGLVLTVVALLVRPAPAAATTPGTTTQTSTPVSSPPTASPSPSPPRQEQQRYRVYVSTVVTNGT